MKRGRSPGYGRSGAHGLPHPAGEPGLATGSREPAGWSAQIWAPASDVLVSSLLLLRSSGRSAARPRIPAPGCSVGSAALRLALGWVSD